MSEDVKLTILISDELRRQAKAAAALRGVTLSDIIRDALQRFVAEQGQDRAEAERRTSTPQKIDRTDA